MKIDFKFSYDTENKEFDVSFDGNPIDFGKALAEYMLLVEANKKDFAAESNVVVAIKTAVEYYDLTKQKLNH